MTQQCLVQYLNSDPRLEGASGADDLLGAVSTLYETELQAGTVVHDAKCLEHFRYTDSVRPFDLSVQFNPRRAGRPFNPAECPVCLPTVRRLGRQRYLSIRINGRPFFVLVNTFPVMPAALVILSAQHAPQVLDPNPDPWHESGIHRTIRDMAALALDLPGYTIIFNGRHAGASLSHFHYQAFRLPEEYGPLALHELARSGYARWIGYADDYPLAVHWARGAAESVIAATTEVATAWCAVQGASASANLIATAGTEGVQLCFVPRNGLFSVGLLGGPIGAIETAGLTVCSNPSDRERIRSGEVNFDLLWRNLAMVRPTRAEELRARCEASHGS